MYDDDMERSTPDASIGSWPTALTKVSTIHVLIAMVLESVLLSAEGRGISLGVRSGALGRCLIIDRKVGIELLSDSVAGCGNGSSHTVRGEDCRVP